MSEKFCLKWNDFHSNVSKSFGRLRHENEFYDVTLVSDDQKQVSAHKLILSSSSEYFRNIFKQNKHQNPLLCLDGITFSELNSVMDYIYHGKVNIYQEDLERFLKIAEKLRLEGLMGGDDLKSIQQKDDNELIDQDTIQTKPEIFDEANQRVQEKVLEKIDDQLVIPNPSNKIIINSEEFTTIEELDAKILEHIEKTADGKWMCNICERKMRTRAYVKEHFETHIVGLSFPCQQCSFVCRSRHSLRDHTTRAHKNNRF